MPLDICASFLTSKFVTEELGSAGVLKELEESKSAAETALRGFGANTEGVPACSRRIESALAVANKEGDSVLVELVWFAFDFRPDRFKLPCEPEDVRNKPFRLVDLDAFFPAEELWSDKSESLIDEGT